MRSSTWWRIGLRNLWRNPRRTLITALGLAVGYFAVVFMVGWADGLKAEMIENGTGLLTGQIQIHSPEYRPERSIYETIGGREGANVDEIIRTILTDPAVEAATPRVFAGGLVSSGKSTSAAVLMGIDPGREPDVSRILSSVQRGSIPKVEDDDILIGAEMARQLELDVGDEIILVAPGADGSMGNDIFQVGGVFRTGLANLDASYALLPLKALQTLVSLDPKRVHEIALATTSPWLAPEAADRLAEELLPFDLEIEIEPWTRSRPEMLDYSRLMESWYFIAVAVVFGIAIFGVANTMLMATFERRREFAVMLAMGTTPPEVLVTVLCEAMALGLLSLAVGTAITLPLILWWQNSPLDLSWLYNELTMFGALIRPVLRIELNLTMAVWTGVALLTTTLVAALYPAARAARIPPADTLSGI